MLRVLIVEPEPLFARELTTPAARANLRVVSCTSTEAANGDCLAECDVVLLGAQLPAAERHDLIRTLKTQFAKPIVVVAEESEEAVVPLLEAGASGYIAEGSSPDEIIQALDAIYQGKPPFSQRIGTALVERMNELLELRRSSLNGVIMDQSQHDAKLSVRELEILRLMTNGMSNQEIAIQLMIQVGTVKNHVHNILKKLGVSNRSQAAQYYMLLNAGTPNTNGSDTLSEPFSNLYSSRAETINA